MKRLIFSIIICLVSITTFAQSSSDVHIQNSYTDSGGAYRLFSTLNMDTFIKLNTRNGQMWQVQWSLDIDPKYRYEDTLWIIPLVNKNEEKDGRFFLYPTKNIHIFILLDQINGREWQVQWGKGGDRWVMPINF
ncbi:MAG: hypothetical protein JST87_04160 [Bacteroidetes bacterium]|nr:hypothetical protein [Bacteroidota bacterium]